MPQSSVHLKVFESLHWRAISIALCQKEPISAVLDDSSDSEPTDNWSDTSSDKDDSPMCLLPLSADSFVLLLMLHTMSIDPDSDDVVSIVEKINLIYQNILKSICYAGGTSPSLEVYTLK